MFLKSLKGKMMLVVSLLLVLLIAGTSYLLYNQAENILRENIFDNALKQAENNAQIITNWLKGIDNQIGALANTASVKSLDWNKMKSDLKTIAGKHDYINGIFIADKSGKSYITSAEENQFNISDREYFQKTIKNKKGTISRPIIDKSSGKQIVVVCSPVMENNEVIGVLGTTIQLSYLQTLVENMKIGGNGYGWLIDNEKNTIAHPEDEYLGNKKVLEDGNQELRDIADRMVEGEAVTLSYSLEGVDKYLASAPINLTGWSIAITAESKDLLSPLKVIRNSSLWIGLIAILLGLVAAFLIARYIATPVQLATEQAKLIASGDLTGDIPEKVIERNDEIGILGKAFKEMTEYLRSMINNISEIAGDLSASSEELSASSEEISASAEQVGTAIQEVASGAEEQSAQIDETKDNIDDLTGQIRNVGDMSDNMDDMAGKVMSNIKKGNKSIDNSIIQVKEVKDQTGKVAGRINELGELSEEIGNIIELINGISTQTNLLALNAAIEAARAGEAGRGFSVVADEIRELAEESSEATEKIAGLIKDIQAGVDDTIYQMNEAEDAVENSVDAIQTTEDSFTEIDGAADNLRELIKNISAAAKGMANNSEKVEKAVKEIAAVSQEASGNAEEVAASSEEQSASTQEIVEASENLAEMAQELSEAVDQFKF